MKRVLVCTDSSYHFIHLSCQPELQIGMHMSWRSAISPRRSECTTAQLAIPRMLWLLMLHFAFVRAGSAVGLVWGGGLLHKCAAKLKLLMS